MFVRIKIKIISCLFLSVLMVFPVSAQVTREPYLQNATKTSMTIKWRSSSYYIGRINYGLSASDLNQTVSGNSSTTDHEINITGLQANTKYFYRVGSANGMETPTDANQQYFITHPHSAKPTRIWILGDAGTGGYGQQLVRNAYYNYDNEKTDVILALGDNAYDNGTDSEYGSNFFNVYNQILWNTPVWSTQGNHEVYTSVYTDVFSHPTQGEAGGLASGSELYYSFDYGDIHFVCLDSFFVAIDINPGAPQYQWLENDLASTNKKWIIGFWHHPSYSISGHSSDNELGMVELRENAVSILEQYGVDAVFSGHNHNYSRTYFINGHYGTSNTFDPNTHKVQGGDGFNPPYNKTTSKGAVYVVSGSAGQAGYGLDTHPANTKRIEALGSFVLDISGDTLHGRFLRETGAVEDEFMITKSSINQSPTAHFTYSVSKLSVNFIDGSSDPEGSILQYAWSFGDGATSDLSSPFHQYASEGHYTVSLTVTDSEGLTDTFTESVTVSTANIPPVSHFTYASDLLKVDFTDASYDVDGSIVSYFWDFGNGFTSNQDSPQHLFSWAGSYNVELTVTDNEGLNDKKVQTLVLSDDDGRQLENDIPKMNLFGSQQEELHYTLAVPSNVEKLTFTISGGAGDADLYVLFNATPTTSRYDCRPYITGNNETCDIKPIQQGTYHVMLRGYTSFRDVTLMASYTEKVNSAPRFIDNPVYMPSAIVLENYLQSLLTHANDPDGDPLIFSKLSGADWLSIEENGNITGTPSLTDIGNHSFDIQVSDGALTDNAVLIINVNDGSLSPIIFKDDFESSLGNWKNHSTVDDQDWTRNQAGTPSLNTGPLSGSDSLYYVYFETTEGSGAYHLGETAILESRLFSSSQTTLTFQAHMFGDDMGTLSLDVKAGDNWSNDVWSISGQQQNSQSQGYITKEIDLTGYTQVTQLRLKATAAGGYRGDMALDNIVLRGKQFQVAPTFHSDPLIKPNATQNIDYINQLKDDAYDINNDDLQFSKVSGPEWLTVSETGEISGMPLSSNVGVNQFIVRVSDGERHDDTSLKINVIDGSTMITLFNESFEGGWGGFGNSTEDSDNWYRVSSTTPSEYTGPNSGAKGSSIFAYMETSSCCAYNEGDTALLVSEVINGSQRTLKFYYHMYGNDIGNLSVDVFHNDTWSNNVWAMSGQQHSSHSDAWSAANLDLTSYIGPIKIRFNATAVGGWQGDISIDEILVEGVP